MSRYARTLRNTDSEKSQSRALWRETFLYSRNSSSWKNSDSDGCLTL